MNDDLKRLIEIARTLKDCKQQVSRSSLRLQFHYETGHDPSDADIAKILGKESKNV